LSSLLAEDWENDSEIPTALYIPFVFSELHILYHSPVRFRPILGNPVEGERDSGLKPNTIPL
jgi:hypothetical protein